MPPKCGFWDTNLHCSFWVFVKLYISQQQFLRAVSTSASLYDWVKKKWFAPLSDIDVGGVSAVITGSWFVTTRAFLQSGVFSCVSCWQECVCVSWGNYHTVTVCSTSATRWLTGTQTLFVCLQHTPCDCPIRPITRQCQEGYFQNIFGYSNDFGLLQNYTNIATSI